MIAGRRGPAKIPGIKGCRVSRIASVRRAAYPPGVAIAVTPTPTGLPRGVAVSLDDDELAALAAWHLAVSDGGLQPWWPAAVRRLPLQARLALSQDVDLAAAWEVRERRRVTSDVEYFVSGYGHVQGETGPPVPFDLWPEQREVLNDFVEHPLVVVLKARQLGLTWLALHYAAWVLAFNAMTPNARILALSKHGGDATKLMARTRAILGRLPPFLRPTEDQATRRSLSQLQLTGRGSMTSLAGSPDAARFETATLALLDEFAFIRNRAAHATWTAVLGTLGTGSKAFVISTGNGPAEAPGDGQAFARLYQQARAGDGLHAVFLPADAHPDRDEKWMQAKRAEFLTDEDFEAEYPLTEDEALAGQSGLKVYSPAAINAAVRLGRDLDVLLAAGKIRPHGGFVHVGADWGEFTALLVVWPLEGGGVYIPPGEVVPELPTEVKDNIQLLHEHCSAWMPEGVLLREMRFDAADPQSTRTAAGVIQASPLAAMWDTLRGRVRTCPVAFGARTDGSGKGYKTETKDYLRHLFARAAKGETSRVIAISPTNVTLIRQLRGLELVDDGSGRIVKRDDHAPDALIAGTAPIAVQYRGRGLGRET